MIRVISKIILVLCFVCLQNVVASEAFTAKATRNSSHYIALAVFLPFELLFFV